MKIAFEQWMAEVDEYLENNVCMSSADLPDCNYREWYDNGISAGTAARRAAKNAQE